MKAFLHQTLCYVMLCYVTLRYVMLLCYVMFRIQIVKMDPKLKHNNAVDTGGSFRLANKIATKNVPPPDVTLRLRYVTLRYVTLRYVTLRYVTLRYVMLCYVMLCSVLLCYVMLCYVMFRTQCRISRHQ